LIRFLKKHLIIVKKGEKMEKINGDYIASLIYEDMTSNKVVEILDELGLEQPVLDEQYEMDLEVGILDKNNGLGFDFREIEGYTKNGEPCLRKISFEKTYTESLPFGINSSDNYRTVKEKIGRKADFKDDKILTHMRKWVMETPKGLKYTVNIFFRDEKKLEGIDSITIMNINEERDNSDCLPIIEAICKKFLYSYAVCPFCSQKKLRYCEHNDIICKGCDSKLNTMLSKWTLSETGRNIIKGKENNENS
jgi:hypothetical protein